MRSCFLRLFVLFSITPPVGFARHSPSTNPSEGVKNAAALGVPGPLCVFGDQALPVVAGGSGDGTREPVVAAARYAAGRVVALGHDAK